MTKSICRTKRVLSCPNAKLEHTTTANLGSTEQENRGQHIVCKSELLRMYSPLPPSSCAVCSLRFSQLGRERDVEAARPLGLVLLSVVKEPPA